MTVSELIQDILEAKYCGDLFDEKPENDLKADYRNFAKQIHPDICKDPRAEEAFSKLKQLYARAIKCVELGTWDERNVVKLPGIGKIYYRDSKLFELGNRYVTNDQVIYVFDPDKGRYLKNYVDHVNCLRFPNQEMDRIYRPKLPVIQKRTDRALFIKKDPREFPMDLFLSAYKDKLTGKDIAWMISRMCDFLCYLQYNDLFVLNGFIPENLFINPDKHSISIYGGWWYCTKSGQKMIGTCREIYDIMPLSNRNTKMATTFTDVESIRVMFQKICAGKDIPEPIKKWLNAGSLVNPLDEYHRWDEALNKAYGERKFIVFSANADEIYLQN